MSVEAWRDLLWRVTEVWPQLHVTKCKRDVMPVHGAGGGRGRPAVFNVGAAEMMWNIQGQLQDVASVSDRERGRPIRYREVGELVALLHRNAGWVDRHAGSGEWYAALTRLVRDAWSVVDRPPNLVRLGLCGGVIAPDMTAAGTECRAELWHEPDQAVVQCPVCGATVEVRQRRDENLARAAAFRAPLSTVVAALSSSGMGITEVQARHWTKRRDKHGRLMLEHAAVRADGVKLYTVGDVVAASNRTRRKKAVLDA